LFQARSTKGKRETTRSGSLLGLCHQPKEMNMRDALMALTLAGAAVLGGGAASAFPLAPFGPTESFD
jgi:hypothetical protein